ncbi:MAG: hypothetical protein A3I26_01270 [Candidatus Yanofskybacteria bacterium RIFCSPLOWO2_02_FULL_43_10]|nr:MAG: hypothetical protein A3C69_02425 [Candidatus Yanofskybacteria bacterium RIFCSPHIGHO2_02_FULL_43_12]OGN28400.1 MAG: hypothetical protein A3I26_01270 [Candidatus Yanofskybacteria bacterium RIFCSPLOWO2_02_FULL_43_10]
MAMSILNADAILIGLIYFNIVSPFNAFLVAFFISVPEIPLWYWTLSKLYLNYVIPTAEEVVENATKGGYFYWDIEYWVEKFKSVRNPVSWHMKIVLRVIKLLGYYGLFIISSEPFPFGRTLTIMSCVVTRSRLGLIPISLGNIVHLYGASVLWSAIFQ